MILVGIHHGSEPVDQVGACGCVRNVIRGREPVLQHNSNAVLQQRVQELRVIQRIIPSV